MTSPFEALPAESIHADAVADRAPDPRRHYASPEDLRDDIELSLDTRRHLLLQWKHEVDAQLAAEAEGMSASDPIRAEAEARLAGEARRVGKALTTVEQSTAAIQG